MRLYTERSLTRLGKISVILIIVAFGSWLFVNNAQNCLSRDFVEKASPAVCWRATNDYESTIEYSQAVYVSLIMLATIGSSVTVSRIRIRRTSNSLAKKRQATVFLAVASILLLTFTITILTIYQKTQYNNNNYLLNTITDVTIKSGAITWLVVTTSAVTYWLSTFKRRDS